MATNSASIAAAAASGDTQLERELTYLEVKSHGEKSDLYVVIHDAVYDCTKFVYEHPGGEEVLLDYAGIDATDAFEDVGHSEEAREVLNSLFHAKLKRMPGDPAPSAPPPGAAKTVNIDSASGLGTGMYLICILAAAAAVGAWKFMAVKEDK